MAQLAGLEPDMHLANDLLFNSKPPNNVDYDDTDYEHYDLESSSFMHRRKNS